MKNIFKTVFLAILFSGVMTSCSDDDTDIPYVDKPLFKESFDDNFPTWVRYSEVGAQVWESAAFGNPSGFCAKMSGFASSANNANIDWLISPAQDLSKFTSAAFAFDNAYSFAGAPIEVYISKNYSGAGNPNAAGVEWTKINGAKLSTGNYVYKFSGVIDISSFAGAGNETVYIAFKYTSTTAASSTWEIDNVKVYGN